MGSCLRKRSKKYHQSKKQPKQPQPGYRNPPPLPKKDVFVAVNSDESDDANEPASISAGDESNKRHDETLTVGLLREAFDDEKITNFEKFLSQLNTIPKFCRIYSVNKVDKADGFEPTYFNKPLDRGGHPYFCPNGWRRYSLDLGKTQEEFDEEFGSWPVVYHGTDPLNVNKILNNGIKPSDMGCFLKEGQRAVYLSPSIEYSGHPRYARIMKLKNGYYMQICLQIRINYSMVTEKKPGTLPGAFANCDPVDPNFKDNKQLEWLIHWESNRNISKGDGLIIYGLMLRITKFHPFNLPQNKWWKHWLDKGNRISYLHTNS